MLSVLSPPDRAVLKFYAYQAFAVGGFHVPIATLLYLSRGLTYGEIGALWAIQMAARVVLEVPAGYIGDRIGWRNSVLVASAAFVASSVGYGLAHSFWAFVVPNLLVAIYFTFSSGSIDAWLYEILRERLDESEFARIGGRATAISLTTMGVASVLGGYIGDISYAYAYYATAAMSAVAFGVLLTFPKTSQYSDTEDDVGEDEAGDDDHRLTFREAITIAREVLFVPGTRTLVAFMALFVSAAGAINALFVQPVVVERWLTVDLLGWLYGAFTAITAVVSYFVGDIKDRLGIRGWFASFPFVLAALVGAAAFVAPILAIPAFVALRIGQRVSKPLMSQYLNDRAASTGRATVLSVASMVYVSVGVAMRLVSGALGDALTPLAATGVLGVGVGVGAVLLRPWQLGDADPDADEAESAPAGT